MGSVDKNIDDDEWVSPEELLPPLELPSPVAVATTTKKRRRTFVEKRNQLSTEEYERAKTQALDLLLNGQMNSTSHPICPSASCSNTDSTIIPEDGRWICTECGSVLSEAIISDEKHRVLVDKDTGMDDNGNKIHYHPDLTARVTLPDGNITTRTVMTSTFTRQCDTKDPLETTIKRINETILRVVDNPISRLSGNDKLLDTCDKSVRSFIYNRKGDHKTAWLHQTSIIKIAIDILEHSCLELGLGITRKEIYGLLGEAAPEKAKSRWTKRVKEDAGLTTLDDEKVLNAHIKRFASLIGSTSTTERRHMYIISSWVLCVLDEVHRFPCPGPRGVPYINTLEPMLDPCIAGEDGNMEDKTDGGDVGGSDDWIYKLISHSKELHAIEEQQQHKTFWKPYLRTTVPDATTTKKQRWPIKKMKMDQLAATIVWLVIRLRPVNQTSSQKNLTNYLHQPELTLGIIPKTLTPRQLQRRHSKTINSSSSDKRTMKYPRLTQKHISDSTGISSPVMAKGRKALHQAYRCLMQ